MNFLSNNRVDNTTIIPPRKPIMTALYGETVAHPAVIETRPAIAPLSECDI